jgi:hypothetical protein
VQIPSIQITSEELAGCALNGERLEVGSGHLQSEGCLILDGLFPVDSIVRLRSAFLKGYAGYLEDRPHTDALCVGDRRFMITVRVEPPFEDPQIYANPIVLQLLRKRLNDNLVLGSFGCVVALPGAGDQHCHRDGTALFETGFFDGMLPCYAITLVIPLVEMNQSTGMTRLWPRTHRIMGTDPTKTVACEQIVKVGSAFLMDYRLLHQGLGNCSSEVRPILYLVYNRPWYTDPANFWRQSPLLINRSAFETMPSAQKKLFARANIVD